MKTLIEALKAVRKFADENEWVQGDFWKVLGYRTADNGEREIVYGYCLLGCVTRAVPWDWEGPVSDAIYKYLVNARDYPFGIASWNDRLGRTKQDVLDLLDAVIAAEEGKDQ